MVIYDYILVHMGAKQSKKCITCKKINNTKSVECMECIFNQIKEPLPRKKKDETSKTLKENLRKYVDCKLQFSC